MFRVLRFPPHEEHGRSVTFPLKRKGFELMKRYLAEHWDTVLCIGLSILLAIGGVLAYFWLFPSK